MNTFLEMLKEADQKSLSRYISVTLILLFVIVTLFLVISNHSWSNYSDFAYVTIVGGVGTQMTNKFINSKYNTKLGEAGKPMSSSLQQHIVNTVNNNDTFVKGEK